MARISLRAYHHEIEDLIETHQFDQAIAHCRHILKYYPKNIAAYRLMGKAFLESHRYGDAADVFLRVLSSVPDDFVSHVGMSIIREDEGNLDEAIWHMERAFETQPANSAIQAELRRLHGRREGVEPPKIRLTRAALARMYVKGELYPQAIAELRAGLQEDPKRYDLQVVLAQAYHRSGQRTEAVEVCAQLLKSLPYCLEANRILADILSQSERTEEARIYANRLASLDPYAAHISPASPTPDKVPDSAVLLEKLEWRPGLHFAGAPGQPEWASSLGIELGETGAAGESIPDWLVEVQTPESAPPLEKEKPFVEPQPVVKAEEDVIPDWMKEAGWSAPGEATEDTGGFLPLEEITPREEDLAPGEMPEWLKSIAPSRSEEATLPLPSEEAESAPGEEEPAVVPPWLEETPPGPTDSVAVWLESQVPQPPIEAELELEAGAPEVIPDWLRELGEPMAGETAQSEALSEEAELVSLVKPESEQPAEEVSAESVAEWLETLEPPKAAPPAEPEEVEAIPTPIEAAMEPEIEPAAEVPEWLQGIEMESTPQPGAEEETLEFEALDESRIPLARQPEEEDAFAWLESLAARQGAEEALLLSPEERRQEPPAWVLEDAAAGEKIEAQVEAEAPEEVMEAAEPEAISAAEPEIVETASPEVESVVYEEEQAAVAAEPVEISSEGEEMLFYPLEAAVETMPAEAEEQLAIEEVPILEEDTKPTAAKPSALGLGEEFEAGVPAMAAEEIAQPEVVEAAVLAEVEQVAEMVEPEQVEAPTVAEAPPAEDEAFAWLESLAARQGVEEALLLKPEERRETPPEWVLEEVSAEVEPAEPVQPAPEPVVEEAPAVPELPTWLADVEAAGGEEEAEWLPVEPESQVEAPFTSELVTVAEAGDIPEMVSQPVLDLNSAGLAELEKLWGIGFVKAQAILEYRQVHGPFHSVDELLNVPGITEDELSMIRDQVFVSVAEPAVEFEQPAEEREIILLQARNALVAGDIQDALARYRVLIESSAMLSEVINDLNEALYRFPIDVSIWEALGDAHLRAGHLQDALDSYTKAEEYLRE